MRETWTEWTYALPVAVGTALIVLVSIDVGFRAGRHRARRASHETPNAVEAMIGPTLGLLAFLVAISFQIALLRFDDRRSAFLHEVNALGTTHLRAGLLPEPHRGEVRALLRSYADVRLDLDPQQLDIALAASADLQRALWTHVVALGTESPGSIQVGLFEQAVNELIDLEGVRLAAYRARIPTVVWLVLATVAVLGTAQTGYVAGLTGPARPRATWTLAVSFAAAIALVADLDDPLRGSVRVDLTPLRVLRASMEAAR